MKIAVIGTGYVGLVSGVCFAELSFNVACVDKDEAKLKKLSQGIPTIYEEGLAELLNKNKACLSFTNSHQEAVSQADAVFIAVGTPPKKGEGDINQEGSADLSFVYKVAEEIAPHLQENAVVVVKSTVSVGTNDEVERIIKSHTKVNFDIASNPEFLREGKAIKDFMQPDRIVAGVKSQNAKEVIERLYKPLTAKGVPLFITDIRSSELIKYTANAFIATKIAFINEIANMCEATGAKIADVAKGIGLDKRIGGLYLNAGPGYGGSCFPKDTMALSHTAKEHHINLSIVDSVIASNANRKMQMAQRVGDIVGKAAKIALFGLAFKEGTDDIRYSPAIEIAEYLLLKYDDISIQAYDKEAVENAKKHFGDNNFEGKNLLSKIKFFNSAYEAVKGATAIVIATEWEEFKELDYKEIKQDMKGKQIIDLRNLLQKGQMESLGYEYYSIGG